MTTATDAPAKLPCYFCAADLPACNSRRLLSGRRCCDRCAHASNGGTAT